MFSGFYILSIISNKCCLVKYFCLHFLYIRDKIVDMIKNLIDTHAHLDDKVFTLDQDKVISRANESGVQHIINIGTDLETSKRSVELAHKYDEIYAAIGIHPHNALDIARKSGNAYQELEKLARKDNVVAIGEIGLDYYRNLSPQDAQQEVFRQLIRLAKRVNLPMIIHCRDAAEDTLAILKEEWHNSTDTNIAGVFHAFSGDETVLSFALEVGFYLSITGVITFAKSKLPEIIKLIPLDKLLIETDCPYLTPMPYRGKRNEPAYLVYIAEKIATILGVTPSDIAEINRLNVYRLFKIEEVNKKGGKRLW